MGGGPIYIYIYMLTKNWRTCLTIRFLPENYLRLKMIFDNKSKCLWYEDSTYDHFETAENFRVPVHHG